MLTPTWSHKPITAMKFLSRTIIIAASGNAVFIYETSESKQLCKEILNTENFVNGIENEATKVSCSCKNSVDMAENHKQNSIFTAIYGNRFCTVMKYCSVKQELSVISSPTIDSFVCGCYLASNDNSLKLLVTTTKNDIIIHNINPDACLGVIKISGVSLQYSVSFHLIDCGSEDITLCFSATSHGISVWNLKKSNDDTRNEISIDLVCAFGCQKGIIFSVDTSSCQGILPPDKGPILTATAAEDRSVVVWSSRRICSCAISIENYESWEPLWKFENTDKNTGQLLFGARIWRVRIGRWGIATAGEDCRLIYCAWPTLMNSKAEMKPLSIEGVHSGRSIWCLDALQDDSLSNLLLASGGNDGAIAVTTINIGSGDMVADRFKTTVKLPFSMLNSAAGSSLDESKQEPSICENVGFPEETQCSDKLREVFIGASGDIFCILESGLLVKATIHLNDSNKSVTHTLESVLPCFAENAPSSISQFSTYSTTQIGPTFVRQDLLFPGYCVIGVHPDRTRIALGGRWGQLAVYKFTESALICLDVVTLPISNKVMSLIWSSPLGLIVGIFPQDTILLRLREGFFLQNRDTEPFETGGICEKVVHLNRPDMSDLKRTDLSWTTCAIQINSADLFPIILTGTRSGSLYLYKIEYKVENDFNLFPVWKQEQCHGHGGVTAVVLVASTTKMAYILTAGRLHGSVRRWSLNLTAKDGNFSLIPLDQIVKPSGLTWVARFLPISSGEILALGFSSKYFNAVEIATCNAQTMNSSGKSLLKVDCAGGNRCWDCAIVHSPCSSSSTAKSLMFCAIERDGILVSIREFSSDSCFHVNTSNTDNFTVKYIRPRLHGKDINTCLLLPVSNTPNNLEENVFLCLTGGEDIKLGSFTIEHSGHKRFENSSSDVSQFNAIISHPRFHSGHVSSIRCISPVLSKFRNRSNESPRYVVTGGGRGVVALWCLFDSNEKLSPGLIGWVRLDTSVSNSTKLTTFPVKSVRRSKAVSDLRIMRLLSYEFSEKDIMVIAGCSDGSLRLLICILPRKETNWTVKFNHLFNITDALPFAQNISCVLDLILLDSIFNETTKNVDVDDGHYSVQFVFSNTGGLTRGCSLHMRDSISVQSLFELTIRIKNPITNKEGSCPVNSLFYFQRFQILAAGADDGSVRLMHHLNYSRLASTQQLEWFAKAKFHYAAVVKVVGLVPELYDVNPRIISLGADQRLIFFDVQAIGESSLPSLNVLNVITLAGLGDPHDISVCRLITQLEKNTTQNHIAMISGSGLQLVCISLPESIEHHIN